MAALLSTTMMMTRFSDGRWLVWLRCEHLFVNGFETGYAVNPMAESNQCMVTGQVHVAIMVHVLQLCTSTAAVTELQVV